MPISSACQSLRTSINDLLPRDRRGGRPSGFDRLTRRIDFQQRPNLFWSGADRDRAIQAGTGKCQLGRLRGQNRRSFAQGVASVSDDARTNSVSDGQFERSRRIPAGDSARNRRFGFPTCDATWCRSDKSSHSMICKGNFPGTERGRSFPLDSRWLIGGPGMANL